MIRIKNQQGFLLISLLIAVAIIALLAAYFYGKSGPNKQSVIQTGQNAEQQLKDSNQKLQDYQNQLQAQ